LIAETLDIGCFYAGYVMAAATRDKRFAKLFSLPKLHRFYGGLALGYPKFGFKNYMERKPAVIVTACTTPWPFNFIAAESRGAVKAVREVLHYGGYKILGKIVKPGTKNKPQISQKLQNKAKVIGSRF